MSSSTRAKILVPRTKNYKMFRGTFYALVQKTCPQDKNERLLNNRLGKAILHGRDKILVLHWCSCRIDTFIPFQILADRVNQPPKAKVTPDMNTVLLPTNKAVIDASGSTDDTKDELSYKWEIISSPLGFKQELLDVPIITMEKLVAGNYSIKVTVTDSDGATDSAIAKLVVMGETDYPPTANAGT